MTLTRTLGATAPFWPPPVPDLQPVGAHERRPACWRERTIPRLAWAHERERGWLVREKTLHMCSSHAYPHVVRPARSESEAVRVGPSPVHTQAQIMAYRCCPLSFSALTSHGARRTSSYVFPHPDLTGTERYHGPSGLSMHVWQHQHHAQVVDDDDDTHGALRSRALDF